MSSVGSLENGRWVSSEGGEAAGTIFCKDFPPQLDPELTTCISRTYQSFSETAQTANEWVRTVGGGCEIMNCEAIPYPYSGAPSSHLPDTWPYTSYLRGLRVWMRRTEGGGESGRALITYRDFAPRLDSKNLFSREHDDVNMILERVNQYLASRSPASRVLSLQTVDNPLSGVLDLDVDTEKSRLTFNQHGFTKYCRWLRLFMLTRYRGDPRLGMQDSRPSPSTTTTLAIKDFSPRTRTDLLAKEETVPELIERALAWCQSTPGLTLVNMQVLPLKAGRVTSSSVYMLESPGHIQNKFTSFVRIVFTLDEERATQSPIKSYHEEEEEEEEGEGERKSGKEEEEEEEEEGEEGKKEQLPPLRRSKHSERLVEMVKGEDVLSTSEYPLEGMDGLPGVVSIGSRNKPTTITTTTTPGLHCKIFQPQFTNTGGWFSKGDWEEIDKTVSRLNTWVFASQPSIITISTSFKYTKGSTEAWLEKSHWVRHMSGGGQVGVVHVVVLGGPVFTPQPILEKTTSSACVIL